MVGFFLAATLGVKPPTYPPPFSSRSPLRLKDSSGQRTTELLTAGSQARLCQVRLGKFWSNSRVFCDARRTYRKSMVCKPTADITLLHFKGSIWIPNLWTWHLSFFSKTRLPKGLRLQDTAYVWFKSGMPQTTYVVCCFLDIIESWKVAGRSYFDRS